MTRQSTPSLAGLTTLVTVFFAALLCMLSGPVQAAPAVAAQGLRLQLLAEQPTSVFWDSETIQSQTALLFAFRLSNSTDSTQTCSIDWDVVDAWGNTIRDDSVRLEVPPQGVTHRRELVAVKRLGSYVLRTRMERGGTTWRAELPFALIHTPIPQLRPRSFFALQAPAFLSELELDFFARLGARVLVSPWQPDDADAASALEGQLADRLQRKIATVGVVTAGSTSASTELNNRLRALESRYPNLSRWEVGGLSLSNLNTPLGRLLSVDPETRLSMTSTAPRETGDAVGSSPALNGLDLSWPGRFVKNGVPLHTAAQMRALTDTASKISATFGERPAIYWNDQEAASISKDAEDGAARDENARAAATLTTNYLQAIMAGASGLSTKFNATAATPASSAFSGRSMARAAAFAALVGRLENTGYVRDVFLESPVLWGALFQEVGESSNTLAALWCAPDQENKEQKGRLLVRLPRDLSRWPEGTRLYDIFGNEIAAPNGRQIVVPLSHAPVMLVTPLPAERLSSMLRSAVIEGVRPLAAQLLPFTRPLRTRATARVRLQNIWPQSIAGTLRLTAPAGWSLATETQSFKLAAGESRVFEFPIELAPNNFSEREFEIAASRGGSRWVWRQGGRLAIGTKVPTGSIKIDGVLSDWDGVNWMRAPLTGNPDSPPRVALRWDNNNLYIAVRVAEAGLRVRRANETRYRFWDGYDAVQLAFGMGEAGVPANRASVRDTDYGLLLCPFGTDRAGNVEGRALWLWNRSLAFDTLTDQLRWGGAIRGARCVVRRDRTHRATVYEVSLPLSTMPELSPASRAASGVPLRFGWVLHRDDGAAVQWSSENGVFPWWGNGGSLYPPSLLYRAVQTPLGFSTVGAKTASPAARPRPTATPPARRPARPSTPGTAPARRSAPRRAAPPVELPPPTSTLPPAPTPSPRNDGPPILLPMPPSSLPPVAPPTGQPLPPVLPD